MGCDSDNWSIKSIGSQLASCFIAIHDGHFDVGEHGIELLRLSRTDPAWARLEVLMVSHVAAEDKVSQIIALGASDYLLKPLQHDGGRRAHHPGRHR